MKKIGGEGDAQCDSNTMIKCYQILIVDGVVLDSPTLRLDLSLPLVLIWGVNISQSVSQLKIHFSPFGGFQCFAIRI